MSDHKPVASLSPKLLARKGGARPAMRHMASALAAETLQIDGDDHADDLGWNDMGQDGPLPESAPPVLQQRQALAEEFAAPDDMMTGIDVLTRTLRSLAE